MTRGFRNVYKRGSAERAECLDGMLRCCESYVTSRVRHPSIYHYNFKARVSWHPDASLLKYARVRTGREHSHFDKSGYANTIYSYKGGFNP